MLLVAFLLLGGHTIEHAGQLGSIDTLDRSQVLISIRIASTVQNKATTQLDIPETNIDISKEIRTPSTIDFIAV